MTTHIPAIDISKKTAVVTREVEAACREIGFMYIRGHGIAPGTVSRIRQAVIAYFDRPIEDKLRDLISRDNYRGYIPEGFFPFLTGLCSTTGTPAPRLRRNCSVCWPRFLVWSRIGCCEDSGNRSPT